MNFKEKVRLHQKGKYDFAIELLELAKSEMVNTEMYSWNQSYNYYDPEYEDYEKITFYRWRPKYTPKKDIPEYHIAIKLKGVLEKHAKKPKRMKRQLQADNYELHDMYTLLTNVGYHIHVDDFDKITPKMLKRIKSLTLSSEYEEFYSAYKRYMAILPKMKAEQQKYYDEISPLILESLNEVISLVDLNRTDDEIIGFITISTKRRTYRKLNKQLQTKKVNRNGETYFVNKVNMKFNYTNIDKVLGVNEEKLTNSQMMFYGKLKNAIQKEINEKNATPFVFDKDGQIIEINKRYFANKLDAEESAFKHRLKRMQERKNKDFFAPKSK